MSENMRVLVYGHKGWIGHMFVKLLSKLDNCRVILGKSRVDNDDVEKEIKKVRPTHILSTIGRTHGVHNGKVIKTIDFLEQKGRVLENVRDNLYSPLRLALICKKHGIHFTYLGTGCIFEYDDYHLMGSGNGFNENDNPNFFGSAYSVVKGFTDRLMNGYFDKDCLNLRIRMPITADRNSRNFITKITSYEKICSIPNSMSVLPTLLPLAIKLMRDKINGTINLTNPGVISHNEILTMYREIVNPDFTWKNFTVEEQDQILAARRSNNYLNTSKLTGYFPNVPDIHTAVRDTLYKMIEKQVFT